MAVDLAVAPQQFERLLGIEHEPARRGQLRQRRWPETRRYSSATPARPRGPCKAILLFDVLHMMSREEQESCWHDWPSLSRPAWSDAHSRGRCGSGLALYRRSMGKSAEGGGLRVMESVVSLPNCTPSGSECLARHGFMPKCGTCQRALLSPMCCCAYAASVVSGCQQQCGQHQRRRAASARTLDNRHDAD